MFTHNYACHKCVYVYVCIFQMQIWMAHSVWCVHSHLVLLQCLKSSTEGKRDKSNQLGMILPVLIKISNVSLVGINQSKDFILLSFYFDIRIKLNSWPERLFWLILLIKVSLRTIQKHKEFIRRFRATEHPLTPFPGVS